MSEELTPWLIRYAYEQGLFPMADEWGEIGWYQPRRRALFPIAGIHVSRSLARVIRQARFEIRFDTAFEDVIRSCRRPRDNWITEEIVRAYVQVHREGWGHCAECWMDGRLVGGVYGVAMAGYFAAESMFHQETNASKVALWALVERCRERGFVLFDAQIMNPHLASLGAYEVSHAAFMRLLVKALAVHGVSFR